MSGCYVEEVLTVCRLRNVILVGNVALSWTKEWVYIEITEAFTLHRISHPHCYGHVLKRLKGNCKRVKTPQHVVLWFQLKSETYCCLFTVRSHSRL